MVQADVMREKLFTIRMTDEERVRAERVAGQYGLNVAGVIRMLLKREDDALGGQPTMTEVVGAPTKKVTAGVDAVKAPNLAIAAKAARTKKP